MEALRFTWPKRGKKLFVDNGDYYVSSHFGWGETRSHFYGYIYGYKEAADELVGKAILSRRIKILDTFIFPICFLYRQYLELAMKDIYIKYSEMPKDNKIERLNKVNHDLYKIWNEIKPIIKKYSQEKDFKDASIVEGYISQFHNFDKSSLKFRYPVSKRLDKSLQEVVSINLENLRDRMNELYWFFDSCETMIGEIKSFEDEMAKEYMDIMEDYIGEFDY